MKSGVILYQRFAYNHEKRGRNAFSRNVGNYKSEMIVVHHKEIIEIAAHLFCGVHRCINIKLVTVLESRKSTRKHGGLNP